MYRKSSGIEVNEAVEWIIIVSSFPEVPPEVHKALCDFGYKSFRPGQEAAIMRILSGVCEREYV